MLASEAEFLVIFEVVIFEAKKCAFFERVLNVFFQSKLKWT